MFHMNFIHGNFAGVWYDSMNKTTHCAWLTYDDEETFPAGFDGSNDSNQAVHHHERAGRHKHVHHVAGFLQILSGSLVFIDEEIHQQP